MTEAPAIDGLLREHQATVVSDERRSVGRKPFMRPVKIEIDRGRIELQAFSRDVSPKGISLVFDRELNAGQIATLSIHRLFGAPTVIRAELRWCESFGKGWFVSGWRFLDLG